MKIRGFSMAKNATKLYYPIKQVVQSILPIVDEFVIAIGDCDEDDETRKEGWVNFKQVSRIRRRTKKGRNKCVYCTAVFKATFILNYAKKKSVVIQHRRLIFISLNFFKIITP